MASRRSSLLSLKHATWGLFFLFGVRLLFNDLILELGIDEGWWLWDARCHLWNLPTGGVFYSALSPVNYYLCKVIFFLTPPSILSIRLLNSLLVLVSAYLIIRHFQKTSLQHAAFMFITYLWINPHLFRYASWAYLEPKLIVCLVLMYLVIQSGSAWTKKGAWLGLLSGILIATKVNAIGIPIGIVCFMARKKRFREILIFGAFFALVGSLFFYSIYLVDSQGFVEMWNDHTFGRKLGFGWGLHSAIFSQNMRTYFYLATLIIYGITIFKSGFKKTIESNPLPLMVFFGILFVIQSRFFPPRYFLPVAFVALLGCCQLLNQRLKQIPTAKILLFSFLMISASNVLYADAFIWRTKIHGGKELTRVIQKASLEGLRIAAPAHLSVELNYPVQPVGCGTALKSKAFDAMPDLYVHIGVGSDTFADKLYQDHFAAQKIVPTKLGHYSIYRAKKTSTKSRAHKVRNSFISN